MNAARKYDILDTQEVRKDPFSLRSNVKGLTNLNHERNLSNYAEELVSHYAKYDGENYILALSNLPDDEQGELARLYMEYTDRDTSECVHGLIIAIDNSYTCALLALLSDGSRENQENFAEITRRNVITYFSKTLQEILDEACHTYLHNINNENGYYAHCDIEHGDIHWSKF